MSERIAFRRLAWGGIRTSAAGRKALDNAAVVVGFLIDDYALSREDDVLALDRVREMITAAVDRAREAHDLAVRDGEDEC
jgi:hypothetical protein